MARKPIDKPVPEETAKPAEARHPVAVSLVKTHPTPSYYRNGIMITKQPQEVTMTDTQLARLKSDRNLIVKAATATAATDVGE